MSWVEDEINTFLICLQTFFLFSHSLSSSILIFSLRWDQMSHLSFNFWKLSGLPAKDHLASSSPSPASHYLLLPCVFGGFLGGPDEPLPRPAFGSHLADPLGLVFCLSEQRKLWHEFIKVICYTHYKYNDELRPIADHHIYSWQMNYVEDGINTFLTCLQMSPGKSMSCDLLPSNRTLVWIMFSINTSDWEIFFHLWSC